jgi:hypothetical protein
MPESTRYQLAYPRAIRSTGAGWAFGAALLMAILGRLRGNAS